MEKSPDRPRTFFALDISPIITYNYVFVDCIILDTDSPDEFREKKEVRSATLRKIVSG